jgi:hypothetical protein
VVPATLVPYVRSGLLAECGSAIDALEATLAVDEVDTDRWRTGLAQFDCARELIDRIGVTAGSSKCDYTLELTAARSGRLLLDALRAVYDVEVQRLAHAAGDHVQLPLRALPTLRNFIVDTERRLGRATKGVEPLLDASEKRTPRTVKFTR